MSFGTLYTKFRKDLTSLIFDASDSNEAWCKGGAAPAPSSRQLSCDLMYISQSSRTSLEVRLQLCFTSREITTLLSTLLHLGKWDPRSRSRKLTCSVCRIQTRRELLISLCARC